MKKESALHLRLIRILKRRKWDILLPAFGIFFATLFVGLFFSPMHDLPLNIPYLQDNKENPAEKYQFIKGERNRVQAELAELDARIAEFKNKNPRVLPESARPMDQLKHRLRTLKEKERNLQKQLAAADPAPADPDRERLQELLKTYVKLRFSYSAIHPDMSKVKREIAALEQQLESRSQQVASNEEMERSAEKMLQTELATVKSEITWVQKQLNQAGNHSENNTDRTEQYQRLLIQRAHLQAELDNQNRFTLIKPDPIPEKPRRQNVSALLLVGLILGVGTGLTTAVVRELFDKSAYTAEDLAEATQLTVLAAIPEIVTKAGRKRRELP